MKSIHTRFLAIVAVIVLALGCAVVAFAEAEDPYKKYMNSVPGSGIILPAETAIRLEPSLNSEPIGMLKGGTACQTKGLFFSEIDFTEFTIVDLAGLHIDGHETGYGFVDSFDVFPDPKWIMLQDPVIMDATPWSSGTYNGRVSGLVLQIDKNDDYYAIRTLDNLSGTSFIRSYFVYEYAKSTQNLRVVPMSTPIYDDSKTEKIGELPGFTLVDVKSKENDFLHVTAYPGTTNSTTGWIPWQPLQIVVN